MTQKILNTVMDNTPPQICFADFSGDFSSPTAANDLRFGTPTNVQLDTTDLADGAARQSTQFDLGENFATAYKIRIAAELAATPDDGGPLNVHIAPSSSATPATGNPGGCSGADSAYTGYSSNMASSIKQLDGPFTGPTTVQVTTVVQIIEIGFFFPTERYGSLVLEDQCGAAFHSDAAETHIVLDPIVEEIQDAP